MLKKIGVIGMSIVFAVGVWADYPADRKAAVDLARAGKKEQALEAFLKLAADTSTSDLQKSDALQQATECVDLSKQYDRAMELAKKIPIAPLSKACQIKVMENTGKWKEIVENFKDEDIISWPESVNGEAFMARGMAYAGMKDGKNAEEDMKKAVDLLMNDSSKGWALIVLGNIYRGLLNDDAKAIETYRKTYTTNNVNRQCEAAVGVATILKQQQKYDEAMKELTKIYTDQVTMPYWRGRMTRVIGDVLAASGKKDEAMAKYNEALKVKDLPQEIKAECENAINVLKAESK
jgi:predicted negative regulator of RcsB-dependent stress response